MTNFWHPWHHSNLETPQISYKTVKEVMRGQKNHGSSFKT